MKNVHTANDLKKARESLNISQAKVASGIGLNRSYISQFESGQRLLADEVMKSLYDYYCSQGLDESFIPIISVETQIEEGKIILADGFQIPNETWIPGIENLLEKYHANEAELETLLPIPKKKETLLSGSDEEFPRVCDKALQLMAKNYLLIKNIQGIDDILELMGDGDDPQTCKHFLNHVLLCTELGEG